jgi:hypothetical protein
VWDLLVALQQVQGRLDPNIRCLWGTNKVFILQYAESAASLDKTAVIELGNLYPFLLTQTEFIIGT